jgi:hypothetical protein
MLGMWNGMSHMEWFRRADGSIAIGEVAARPPGAQFTTLIGLVTGVDMYRAFAELMVFETFTPPPRRFAAGAAYLRGQGGGKDATIRAVHGDAPPSHTIGQDLSGDLHPATVGHQLHILRPNLVRLSQGQGPGPRTHMDGPIDDRYHQGRLWLSKVLKVV